MTSEIVPVAGLPCNTFVLGFVYEHVRPRYMSGTSLCLDAGADTPIHAPGRIPSCHNTCRQMHRIYTVPGTLNVSVVTLSYTVEVPGEYLRRYISGTALRTGGCRLQGSRPRRPVSHPLRADLAPRVGPFRGRFGSHAYCRRSLYHVDSIFGVG